jgi:hypothetical protein
LILTRTNGQTFPTGPNSVGFGEVKHGITVTRATALRTAEIGKVVVSWRIRLLTAPAHVRSRSVAFQAVFIEVVELIAMGFDAFDDRCSVAGISQGLGHFLVALKHSVEALQPVIRPVAKKCWPVARDGLAILEM